MVKILSLNLCNYHNFGGRKIKIIDFIKKNNPDVVAMQEVRDDLKFNKEGDNQAKQLNEHLKYPYMSFVKTMDVNKVNKTPKLPKRVEGLAILSKLPILKSEKKILKKHPKDKFTRAIMHVKVMSKKPIDILNVHFSPGIKFAKLHFIETLKFSKKIKPIIIGDFNIPDKGIVRKLSSDYNISIDVKDYLSYCPRASVKKDKVHNTKPCTLDYILIPKKSKFKSFDSIDKNLSDHSALIAEIIS